MTGIVEGSDKRDNDFVSGTKNYEYTRSVIIRRENFSRLYSSEGQSDE